MRQTIHCILMPLLFVVVGCQSVQPLPVATVTNDLSPVLTVEQGQIFFIRNGNLWVVNPDGSQMRQLTTEEPPGVGYYIPPGQPGVLIFACTTQVALDTNHVRQVLIPDDCQTPRFPERGASRVFDFRFSPSGHYVSFIVGNHECGESALRIFNTQTGTCSEVEDSDTLVEWLPDDHALVATTRCEYGTLSLYDPLTAQKEFLGYGSIGEWNQSRTAFYVTIPDRIGWASAFWAYNVRADTYIHRPPQDTSTDHGRAEFVFGWTTDGSHLVYTARQLSYTYELTGSLPSIVTFGPSQLYIVDNLGQHDSVLIEDPAHNYFLLGQDAERLIVRRTVYQPLAIPAGPVDWGALECPLYGRECADFEYFSLDWRAGKLEPLRAYPTPIATLVSAAPDLSSQPVYSAPDGSFALYPGGNGEGLWRVSASGERALIVADGHHFVYVEE